MSKHLEVLLARQAAEKVKAAAKPLKVKTSKPVAPEPAAIVFDPKPTLMECIQKLTPEEASNPHTVAGTVTLFVIDQIMRTPRQCALLNDAMSDSLAWLTAAPFMDKVNLKRVFSTALTLVDAVECRSGSEEGSGIRALHEIERVLLQRKSGVKSTGGVNGTC